MILKNICCILVGCFISFSSIHAQSCSGCAIATVDVDLSSNPDTVWTSAVINRDTIPCCNPPDTTATCVRFTVYTHPDAKLLNFETVMGTSPPEQLYSVNCSEWISMGIPMCIGGAVSYCVLVCKPIGDENSFRISSSTATSNPFPGATLNLDRSSLCSPGKVNFSTMSGAQNYFWDYGDGTSEYGTNIISHTFVNNTTDDVIYNVSVTIISMQNCSSTAQASVTVHPVSSALFSLDKGSGCSPLTVTISNKSTNGQTYSWDFGDGTTSDTSVLSFNHEYTITTTVQITRTISFTVTNKEGCPSTYRLPVNIFPKVIAQFTSDTTSGCAPLDVTFTNESTSATIYNWDFGDGIRSSDENPVHVYRNSTPGTKTFNVSLIAESSYGCADTTAPVVITAKGSPIAFFKTDTSSGCTPFMVTIFNQTTNGQAFTWDFGDSTTSTTLAASFTHEFANITSDPLFRTISLVAASSVGCTDVYALPIKEYPGITAQFTPIKTISCSPVDVSFTNLSTGGNVYTWDFGDGDTSSLESPNHKYLNARMNTIDYVVKNVAANIYGCKDSLNGLISVYPKSIAGFIMSNSDICSNTTVTFTNASQNATTFIWNFNDGSATTTETSPSHTFLNSTTVTQNPAVTLISSSVNDCKDTVNLSVMVYPIPSVTLNVDQSSFCSPGAVHFTTNSGAKTYLWDYGDGISEYGTNNVSHIFANNTANDVIDNVSVTVTSMHNCSNSAQTPVIVYPVSTALFSFDKSSGCAPLTFTISNKSTNGQTFDWDFGDGTTGNNTTASFTHLFTNITTSLITNAVSVTATSIEGCVSTYSLPVTVFPEVTAQFTPSKTSGCTPLEVSFTNQSINATQYNWDFGDGFTSANATVTNTYLNTTGVVESRNVVLIAKSSYGCADTTLPTIVAVNPLVNTSFTTDTTSGCSPLNISITNNTQFATSYSWDFGDGTISTVASGLNHTYKNTSEATQTYNIVLKANNLYDCLATATRTVSIYPEVTLDISSSSKTGCSPLIVDFTVTSKNGVNFNWNFGNSEVSNTKNPSHTFINNSTNDVTYTGHTDATSDMGCKDSGNVQITVYPIPHPDFKLNTTNLEIPDKNTVTITNNTLASWQTTWTFGDGTSSTDVNPGSHTYADTGTYKIVLLTKSAHCEDTVSHVVVVVYAKIVADYDSTFQGCAPLTVTFVNKSINTSWYRWDFGDGSAISTDIAPTHTYLTPGSYIVELTASNGVIQDISRAHSVTVYQVPIADFEANPSIVYISNANVQFSNKSKYDQSWLWKFGDGETSTLQEPSHVYGDVGVYDVSLWAYNVHACVDSIYVSKAVTVLKDCNLLFPNAFKPSDVETGGKYVLTVPEETNDIFHPIYRNIVKYHLEIFNRWGELIFASDSIDIGWDGYYRHTLSKLDVYVWKVEATCFGGRNIRQTGNVIPLK